MVRARELCKFYGDRLIFKSTSFEVGEGELWFVVGPNGCGKSTLLRIIAGLCSPSAGEVEREVGKRDIGYVGHFSHLYGGLTALENLDFWRRLYGKGEGDLHIKDILARVGLSLFARERVATFSRGMLQRLNVARLMLLRPKLYLLDEPSSGLDEDSRALLYEFVSRERAKGKAILWVSHERGEWEEMGDNMLVFSEKKFVVIPRRCSR